MIIIKRLFLFTLILSSLIRGKYYTDWCIPILHVARLNVIFVHIYPCIAAILFCVHLSVFLNKHKADKTRVEN
jgi:hypothetical protein